MNLIRPVRRFALLLFVARAASAADPGTEILLDGTWDQGPGHDYQTTVTLPGFFEGTPWLRHLVELPEGPWNHATLRVDASGADTRAWVDGVAAGRSKEGGFELAGPRVAPGQTVIVELSDTRAPVWDSLRLHLWRDQRLRGLAWSADVSRRTLTVSWTPTSSGGSVAFTVRDGDAPVAQAQPVSARLGHAECALPATCETWTPEHPRLYRLRVELRDAHGLLCDAADMTWGFRELRTRGTRTELNGVPVLLRGGVVDWHEWLLNDPEAPPLAFTPDWIDRYLLRRLREYGANFISFAGEPPPQAVLDHCDSLGVMVRTDTPQPGHPSVVLAGPAASRIIAEDLPRFDTTARGDPANDAAADAFLRCLGRIQSAETRLQFQADQLAEAAERCRRQGTGFSPRYLLTAPSVGGSWFMGPEHSPRLKPIWDALEAAFGAVSVSIDSDPLPRNAAPGRALDVSVSCFNDTDHSGLLRTELRLVRIYDGTVMSRQPATVRIDARSSAVQRFPVRLPQAIGDWRLEAEAFDSGAAHPIVSSFHLRTLTPALPPNLRGRSVGVLGLAPEIRAFLAQNRIPATNVDDPASAVILLDADAWRDSAQGLKIGWRTALAAGRSVVWLNVGGVAADLPLSGRVRFEPASEPERFLHPTQTRDDLWRALPFQATWGWNGRGGILVPAENMEVEDAQFTPLASAGLRLERAPVVELSQGPGRLVLSHVITAGRLRREDPDHDPAAEQFVLNLISVAAR